MLVVARWQQWQARFECVGSSRGRYVQPRGSMCSLCTFPGWVVRFLLSSCVVLQSDLADLCLLIHREAFVVALGSARRLDLCLVVGSVWEGGRGVGAEMNELHQSPMFTLPLHDTYICMCIYNMYIYIYILFVCIYISICNL